MKQGIQKQAIGCSKCSIPVKTLICSPISTVLLNMLFLVLFLFLLIISKKRNRRIHNKIYRYQLQHQCVSQRKRQKISIPQNTSKEEDHDCESCPWSFMGFLHRPCMGKLKFLRRSSRHTVKWLIRLSVSKYRD